MSRHVEIISGAQQKADVLSINAPLPVSTAFLDTDEFCTGLGQGKRANAGIGFQPIHRSVNCGNSYGCARAAVHFLIEMTKNDAWRRQ